MTFEEYLVKKRISKEAFAAEDPALYKAWESTYAQMHPNSFYIAMKMVLNNVRLRYHLREEDVPKPATPAAPRPAARRAAAPIPTIEADTSTAIPAAGEVSQETAEEKPVTPAAAPKPRPMVRRPAALQTPPAEGEDAATLPEKPAAEATPPAAPRARPVIKRPVISKPVDQPASEEQAKLPIPDAAATTEASTDTAKPVRPRPVIKRPAALQKPLQEGQESSSEKPAEGIAPASGKATEAPTPPRPRPVMKRPTALQKPSQETEGEKPKEAPTAGIAPADNAAAPETPKPPRPRPIIKRPAALSKPAVPETTMPEATTEAAMPNEETAAPAPPAGDMPTDEKTPTGTSAAEAGIEQPAKPPRPRPIIKRPAPLALPAETAQEAAPAAEGALPATSPEADATSAEAEPKDNQELQSASGITVTPSADDLPAPEEQTDKPKPPRPRPIMRRPPPKTEE